MKTMQGTVQGVQGLTAKVSVVRQWQHPMYQKSVKRSKNYACHIADVKVEVGDQVIIGECRPVSKTKNFVVMEKISE